MWVKITAKGAEETRASMAQVAEDARKLGEMDPTIKIKVDSDAMRKLSAVRTEIRALAADGDKGGLKTLAGALRLVAAGAEDARVKARALRLELDALGALKSLEGGGGGGPSILSGIPGIGGALSSSWPAAIAGLIAALAALPFVAQAAAGGIVLALGGGLAALGVLAEKGIRPVAYQFAQLSAVVSKTFKNLSPAFGEALRTILAGARTFLPEIIRNLGPGINAIARPLTNLAIMIEGTFASPQVATSIREMGKAFGSILTALTPMVPGMFTSISDGFTNIARAIQKNPKAIAALIAGLVHLIGILLDTIAWLAQVAAYLEQHFIPAWDRTRRFLDSWRHAIAANMLGFYHDTLAVFNRVRTDTANIWSSAWNNTVGVTIRGVSSVMAQVRRIPGQINSALGGLPGTLFRIGQNAMSGLMHGLGSLVGSLISQAESWAHSIASAIGNPFGIHLSEPSEAEIMIRAGRNIALGLGKGMRSGTGDVTAAAGLLSRAAMPYGAYGAPGGVLRLEVVGRGGGMLDQLFISWLKNYVRVAGGGGPQSVQRALGQVWR